MPNNIINIQAKPIERIKKNLDDPEFLGDLEHATNILVLVQKRTKEGTVNNLIYACDNMPNLVYMLAKANHMVLSSNVEDE